MTVRQLAATAALVSGFAALGVAGAAAADLPLRSPPPAPFYAPAPVFTWTGFYAGANVGAAFGTTGGALRPNFTTSTGFGDSKDGTGFVGGGQIGYNWQSGQLVYGIEADADYLGLNNKGAFSMTSSVLTPGGTFTATRGTGDGFLGTVRGRIGYAVLPRLLVYGTGGLAYGEFGSNYKSAAFFNTAGVATDIFTTSGSNDIRVGYTVGGGLEYAFTDRLSGKIEYLYADLGRKNYTLTDISNPANTFAAHANGAAQIARVGLNYKF
jgi:outer membrane immunogenic protein